MGAAAEALAQPPVAQSRHPYLRDEIASHKFGQTRASTRSVLHASGASPSPYVARRSASPSRTERGWSRTQTAPLIISTHPRTSGPRVCTSCQEPILVGCDRALDHLAAVLAGRAPRRLAGAPVDTEILHVGLLRRSLLWKH